MNIELERTWKETAKAEFEVKVRVLGCPVNV
jgi:hypothetical protein